MKDRYKKLNINLYLAAFLINLAAGVMSFTWTIIQQGGLFSLAGDFNSQIVPFSMMVNDAIRAGNTGWAWSIDLGSSFLGGMHYYNLGSPSFWISMLFPSGAFMYVVGWLYVLKYAVAGLTSFAYIRRYVKDPYASLTGSVLYAFSGFMATNLLFYIFHDVVALFPLMLLTLDGLVLEKRRGPFIFAVFINALLNYFFIIGEIMFLAAYYVLRFLVPYFKKRIGMLPNVLFEGALGCLLGCFLLFPSFLFTIANPRVSFDYTGSNSLVFSGERYLYILKGLIFPGEVMSHQSAVIENNFSSCNAYLPMVGLILVIAFVSIRKRFWLTRMLKFCLVCAVVPFFNAAYSLFAGLYCRWYYMGILMMALASAMVIERWDLENEVLKEDQRRIRRREAVYRVALMNYEEDETGSLPDPTLSQAEKERIRLEDLRTKRSHTKTHRAIGRSVIIWGTIQLLFILFLIFVKWSDSDPSKIYRKELFFVWAAFTVLGTVLTWLCFCRMEKGAEKVVLVSVLVFSVATTATAIFLYQLAHGEDARHLRDRIESSEEIICHAPEFRFTNKENIEMITHAYPATSNFSTTVSGSIFRVYEALDQERDVKSPEPLEGFYDLVSARYTVEFEAREDEEPVQIVEGKYYTYYVYDNQGVPPIGFTYDTYMTRSEFDETVSSFKAILMLKTLVIPDEEEAVVSDTLRHYDEMRDGIATTEHRHAISSAHLSECSQDTVQTTDSYASTIYADADKYAFYSIPNDDGWKASVNGEPVEIIDINGFMAVPVKEGESRIEFSYHTPGLREGCIMSAGALLVICVYLFWAKKKKANGSLTQKHCDVSTE